MTSATSTPELTVIVISYNTRDMTLEALRSLARETPALAHEVIVVDNDSKDASAEAIAREFPQVRLIRLRENIGFAAANNLAAREARADLLLLLNPDTVVLDRAAERLVAFARSRPHAGIWGGRTLFADRSLNPTSCWRRQTMWSVLCRACGLTGAFRGSRLFDREAMGCWSRDTEREVDIVTGCFFLIERELWERLGGFDPAFFMYGEEADLCLRARAIGARPRFTPGAVIVHYGGASEKVRADKLVRLLRAKAQLIRRHWSAPSAWLGVRLLSVWCLTNSLAWGAIHAIRPSLGAESRASWREVWRRRAEWMHEPPARDAPGRVSTQHHATVGSSPS
ncbi:MAG TPA: glycosyltransferase family 2 protein [Phycisphaerales bacterium]|nr:glycosyltransferase family 2 protein [Phycisphaerales bacterium]